MDETVGVGVGPAERARHAGGDGPTREPRRRMSARRKQEAVLRLLRGEDLELVSRELGVTAAELSGWRDRFLAGGEASLKSRPADARDAEVERLQAKVGELTMATELLEAKIERLEVYRFTVVIPTALVADRFGPLAAGDRGEPVGRRREPVPGLATGRDDRVVVGPDAQAELVLAQVLSHVLDRVRLGAVARQR